jgi:putative SOS response-associated peptidase YedK
MCYSAQVKQTFNRKQKLLFDDIDYHESLKLFERQVRGDKVKVSRAFAANFNEPQTPIGTQAKAAIDQYRSRLRDEYQTTLDAQVERLATANSKLAIKPSKTWAKEQRISTNKIAEFKRKLADFDRQEVKPSDERIWDKEYAGVVVQQGDERLLTPMRFNCRREGRPASDDDKYTGLYNARLDNLERFWKHQFGQTHCIMIIESFWERVALHDFEQRPLADDEIEKRIELHFTPHDASPMIVAGIWSHWEGPDESPFNSFAIVTDDAPDHIMKLGHERCPINLTPEAAQAWLTPQTRSNEELMQILAQRQRPIYDYEVVSKFT